MKKKSRDDLMDLLNGETIIYDQNGNRVSVEDLPEDCELVSVRDLGFEVIKRDFMICKAEKN